MRHIAIVIAWALFVAGLVAAGMLLPLLDIVLLCMGSVCLLFGILWIGAELWFVFRTGRTLGVVMSYKREEGCYRPRVEIITQGGERIVFVSRMGRGAREFKTGQRVTVALDRNSPEDSDIASLSRIFFVPVFATAISFLVVATMLRQLLSGQ